MDVVSSASRFSPLRNAALMIRSDVAWLVFAAVVAGLYAILQHRSFRYGLPITDAYFGADVGRIYADLLSSDTDIGRTPLHPWFPYVGIFYRAIRIATGCSNATLLEIGAFGCGAMMASLTYIAARVWEATCLTAIAAVALIVSSAAFTYWISLPESHSWGGITILTCLILARFLSNSPLQRQLYSATICALSFSVVVTNVVFWGLAAIRPVQRGPLPWFVTRLVGRNFVPLLLAGLAGLGIVLLGFSLERALLRENPTMGYLLFVGHEKKWLLSGRFSDPFGGFHAIGVTAPISEATSIIANALGAAVMIAMLWFGRGLSFSLRIVGLFIPLAVFLHTVYDRNEAFLCSPNYVGIWAVLLALGAGRGRRVVWPVMLIAISILLGGYNSWTHVQTVLALRPDQLFQPD
jgi:hypothetical protein